MAPIAIFARFVLCGGGVGVATSAAVPLLAAQLPWAVANALVTVAGTLLGTELHARFTFGSDHRCGIRRHLQSAGTAVAAYAATTAAVLAIQPLPGSLREQAVYLMASALAGTGRFVVLRLFVFASVGNREPASVGVRTEFVPGDLNASANALRSCHALPHASLHGPPRRVAPCRRAARCRPLGRDRTGPLAVTTPCGRGRPRGCAAVTGSAQRPLLFVGRIDREKVGRQAAPPCDLIWATTRIADANECVALRTGLPEPAVMMWPERPEWDAPDGLHGKTRAWGDRAAGAPSPGSTTKSLSIFRVATDGVTAAEAQRTRHPCR